MSVVTKNASDEIMWNLRRMNAPLKGRCFENCVIAVVGLPVALGLQYVLGFLTPPGHEPVAHAWLLQNSENGPIYLDPTLQDGSLLWKRRSAEFIYDERYRFSKDELLAWFRSHYAGRKFGDLGLPEGSCRGPILNSLGIIE